MSAEADRKAREEWAAARRAEVSYAQRLRQVALQVSSLVAGFAPEGRLRDLVGLTVALERYATLLEPWATSVSSSMVADVSRRTDRVWAEKRGQRLSQALRREVESTPQGMGFRALMEEQVTLIQSIPLGAAERVHELTTGALYAGRRPEVIAQEIARTGAVSISRARLIARTEVSRTAANLMQARAVAAGSEGYLWRTTKDSDVRDTHKDMEGRYVRWSTPPKTDPNLAPYHAGCGPNCRCFAEPVLPDL